MLNGQLCSPLKRLYSETVILENILLSPPVLHSFPPAYLTFLIKLVTVTGIQDFLSEAGLNPPPPSAEGHFRKHSFGFMKGSKQMDNIFWSIFNNTCFFCCKAFHFLSVCCTGMNVFTCRLILMLA